MIVETNVIRRKCNATFTHIRSYVIRLDINLVCFVRHGVY